MVFFVIAVGSCFDAGGTAQMPPGAVVYLDASVSFKGEPASLKATFYELRGDSVGVIISRLNGEEVARANLEDVTQQFYEGTGVFDVTGDGPELVLIGQVGAKTLEAKIFHYKEHGLHKIFDWSGWNLRVVSLQGQPVIAVMPYQYGALSKLYVWEDGKFKEVDDRFPDFYAPEIKEKWGILNAPKGAPVYLIAETCYLGATALVYGKKYEEARRLCAKALAVASEDPTLISQSTRSSLEDLDEERLAAGQAIRKTLENVAKAEEAGTTRLPEQDRQSFRPPYRSN